jgi:hypothetical protein
MGVGEVVTAGSHIVAPAATAAQIGFPAGNPFQWEVAMANLAFAVLGLACLAVRRLDFWLASIIGYLVYFWGCGVGHVVQYVQDDDVAPYNWGPIVPVVFGLPLVLLVLVIALRAVRRRGHGATSAPRRPCPRRSDPGAVDVRPATIGRGPVAGSPRVVRRSRRRGVPRRPAVTPAYPTRGSPWTYWGSATRSSTCSSAPTTTPSARTSCPRAA